MENRKRKWQIWVDTGGTFTDCLGIAPDGSLHRTKVLSNSSLRGTIVEIIDEKTLTISSNWQIPDNFIADFNFNLLDRSTAATKVKSFDTGQSRITLEDSTTQMAWKEQPFEVRSPEESPVLAARCITQTASNQELPAIDLRLATTRGTNALLEKNGAPTALFITRGFGDLLEIGNQRRPDLFVLNIEKPDLIYDEVIEITERIDANGNILTPLDFKSLQVKVEAIVDRGITSAAVVLMNSYQNDVHEIKIEQFLRQSGMDFVSVSSRLSPFIKILPRAQTALVNACLSPVMKTYLDDVQSAARDSDISVMTSAGGLKKRAQFTPKDGLLSGPAAGVVGAVATGRNAGFKNIITFDMGGTSTDVSRYSGNFDYVFEHKVGEAHLMSPALAIETVAAGGGSICHFDGHALRVGPESAGAKPGPACYGAGGPLTITDINILAGRLDQQNFHIPIHVEYSRKKLNEVVEQVSDSSSQNITPEALIEGFLDIANQRMAAAIEKISLRKGYDAAEFAMVAFGGASGQHCCGIARRLGIKKVIISPDAGLLSAYGLGHAVVEHFEEKQILEPLTVIEPHIEGYIEQLSKEALDALAEQVQSDSLMIRRSLILIRIKNQESTLEISYKGGMNLAKEFRETYQKRYGHWIEEAEIEVESLRVVASTEPQYGNTVENEVSKTGAWTPVKTKEILYNGRRIKTPVYNRSQVTAKSTTKGPALVLDPYSTLWVEPGWKLRVNEDGSLVLDEISDAENRKKINRPEAANLELFTHRFTSIADKMGEMLQRTARSVNVKERQDFSCALLNANGELVVNAPHIPVHLGALGICVRSVAEKIKMESGDVVVTNHPAYGGSHLPDVTVIMPVYTDSNTCIGYVVNRAHHAEIGGMQPGSMPPYATNLLQEGVVIKPDYLIKNGVSRFSKVKEKFINAAYPSRNVDENMADLQAQLAACQKGAGELSALVQNYGFEEVDHYMTALTKHASVLMQKTIRGISNGIYKSKELLDDGTPLCAKWIINDETVTIDFSGTGGVHAHNLNATPAIVNSVVMYVLRLLVDQPIPLNEGLMEPVSIKLPHCLLNPFFEDDPQKCPAVVGGNIEVSQRLTDTLLKPFDQVACGQGSMNNVLFGNDSFGYYETVGGGSGAGPDFNGADAVHQHMTNTKGTDPEILEQRYPVRLDRYEIRRGSGGNGRHSGGDGIIREMTFLEPVELSVLSQHRREAPYGRQSGEPGKTGRQWVMRKNGEKIVLEHADKCNLKPGDRFILQTPGGGGFGTQNTNEK